MDVRCSACQNVFGANFVGSGFDRKAEGQDDFKTAAIEDFVTTKPLKLDALRVVDSKMNRLCNGINFRFDFAPDREWSAS